jgi:hypothetical protein
MPSLGRASVVASVIGLTILACGGGGLGVNPDLDGGLGDGGGVDGGGLGRGVGEACDDVNKCRPGLACNSGTCAPGHSSENGAACVISAECKPDLYCGPMRTCAPAGSGDVDASCSSDADCKSGLRCNISGFGAVCQPEGTKDVGGQCTTGAECFAGLGCANGACAPLPPGSVVPIAIPSWTGVDCKDDPPPVAAYFRVPRGTEDGDFFRLPFPNDVRRDPATGHPTLSGFPTPGSALLGFDVVDRYVKDVEANADGFSSYAAVTMRFSGEVDFDTLKAQGVVRIIDLSSGNDLGLFWSATTGRSAYVCNNSIAIRPRQGEPYQPGRTYAVIITTAAKAKGGADITRPSDLVALFGATAPTDNFLGPAHAKYAPLRDWAASKSFDVNTILDATVFTVAKNDEPAKAFATAINPTAAPTVKSWVKCGAGTPPCPDVTGTRACGAADPDFDELQALVTLPIYQKGTAPYLDPPDGDIAYASGVPQKQRDEDVCMAITVPKTAMPANGYPVVVYAHGTGGSFRSHINEGVAKMLAQAGIAVIGIDQVQHGPRRNGSTKSPNDLFFNFTNPGAARGNPLQGAADQLSLVKLARDLDLAAGASPTGADLKFDRIAYWGHSQGATEGAIAMPYATADVSGVLLSGAGASLIDALLTKTSPVNIAAAVPIILNDPQGASSGHPVLGLLQNSIDPADPLNHARALTKDVFVPYGQKDTYTPSAVQATYVLAAGLGMATSAPSVTTPEAIGSLTPIAVPASANLVSPTRTGITRQYAPAGYDGHFVVYKDATGTNDALGFLKDVAAGTPTNPRVGVP